MTHEHRFDFHRGGEFEDGAFHERIECSHAEVLDRSYSEKHDEYFYETGPSCGEVKHIRMDCSAIVRLTDGGSVEDMIMESDDNALHELGKVGDEEEMLSEALDIALYETVHSGGCNHADVEIEHDAKSVVAYVDMHDYAGYIPSYKGDRFVLYFEA